MSPQVEKAVELNSRQSGEHWKKKMKALPRSVTNLLYRLRMLHLLTGSAQLRETALTGLDAQPVVFINGSDVASFATLYEEAILQKRKTANNNVDDPDDRNERLC